MSARLPPIAGEWIDRTQPRAFHFEGQPFTGFAGDTPSSALLAAGQPYLGRSFKYHRPRSVLSAANHDINALFQAGQRLNLRADATPLEAGMRLRAVNTCGSLMRDRLALFDKLSRFLPVGFYYKAFHTRRLFPLWEKLFRAVTGLGRVDFATPRIRTPKNYDFCEVLVVGAGPSGLAAALAAAEAGAQVVVVDEHAQPGGSACYQRGGEPPAAECVTQLRAARAHPRIRIDCDTLAAGYYSDHWVPLIRHDRMSKMRAQAVIVAGGAYEQPAVFRHNDLPGILLASAAQRLIYRYAVRPMQRAVVLAANADGYRAALDLAANGIVVAALLDLRATPGQSDLAQAIASRGIEILTGTAIYQAVATARGDRVAAVDVSPLDADGAPLVAQLRRIACDGVVMSVGWAPAAPLLYQAGTTMHFDVDVQQFVPARLPDGVFACGRVNGVYRLPAKLADGRRAGLAAAAHCGYATEVPDRVAPETESPSHPWPIVPHPLGKEFVDFDEDLHYRDFPNAVQEGFDNIELLKRYTTVGMGPSQGKHANMNALRILARLTGKTPGEVGTTTARPFFHPVALSHLAGRGFTPHRITPLHARHVAAGAVLMPAGDWQRPEYYVRAGQSRAQCIRDEVLAVRHGVGLIDVGTLGKLELRGSQAAEFLERVYIGRYANQKVGSTRYAVMCDESGVIIDDGVVARLDAEHFYFTTTTSGAASVYRELSRLNTQWRLDCGLVNLTGAMAAMNLAGPNARAVLAALTDTDLSDAAFPYLAVRTGSIAGIAARMLRVGFVGEWGVEIHVPAEYGAALWDALMAAGAAMGIRAFGVEAQRVLRLEKGHLIIGQDTDGLTTPLEADLGWALKMDKAFFVGQRSLQIIQAKPLRQRLVGFTLSETYAGPAPQECHLVIEDGDIAGRVTSIALSPSLRRHVGLAFVPPDMAEPGRRFAIRLSNGDLVPANVTPSAFYDPDNARQRVAA